MRIAIVGLGAAGSAALLEAVSCGFEAVGFERFRAGHELGSSHGASRLIRRTYPDAFHSRWMARAYDVWSRVEAATGEELFVRCGGLTFGPEADPQVRDTREALSGGRIPHEVWRREEAAERFPLIDIGQGGLGVFQRDSGFLRADRCIAAQLEAARGKGAVIREGRQVLAIEERGDAVFVSTAESTDRFDAAIVTAGPWVGRLLPELSLPVKVVLRQTVYLEAEGGLEGFAPGKFPVWIHHPSDHYGFPADGVVPGVKTASHHGGPEFDPDLPDRPVMEDLAEQVKGHVRRHIASLGDRILMAKACLYTVTPDERFILDFAPGSRRRIVCSGCSGHGFKFSALLGELAVEMAREGKTAAGAEPWRLARFGAWRK